MKKKALLVLSDGFEDIEGIAIIDILNRVQVDLTIANLIPGTIKGAYGTTIIPDTDLNSVKGQYDAIIFPGGRKNAENLAFSEKVIELTKKNYFEGKLVAAICASPGHVLAEAANILTGKRATGDPVFNDKLARGGAIITDELVTQDGNIITGMGPGAALQFALKIAEYLVGGETPDSFAAKWRLKR